MGILEPLLILVLLILMAVDFFFFFFGGVARHFCNYFTYISSFQSYSSSAGIIISYRLLSPLTSYLLWTHKALSCSQSSRKGLPDSRHGSQVHFTLEPLTHGHLCVVSVLCSVTKAGMSVATGLVGGQDSQSCF